jgi:hypothetical protein
MSSRQMEKLIQKGVATYIAQCHQIEILASKVVHSQHPEIEALIQKYDKALQDLPMKLLPKGKIEHIIEVKLESTPINIKPYRYPHHHKIEIERLNQDLLKCGVVTTSRSPYTTPIVLVQKKDGSFKLCIDYRGLNKITIKKQVSYAIHR